MNRKTFWAIVLTAGILANAYGQNIPGGHDPVMIQIGAFRNPINAHVYLASLNSIGFAPVLYAYGDLHRVLVPVDALDEVFAVVQRLGDAGFRNIWVRNGATVIHSPSPIAQLAPVQATWPTVNQTQPTPVRMAQPAVNLPTTTQTARPARTQPAMEQTIQSASTLPEGMNIEINSYTNYTPGGGVTVFKQIRIGQVRSIAPPEQTMVLIAEEIERLGLQDVFVREVDDGVMLSLENIHFYGDTYILRPGGREEIHRIAEILRLFPERNFLVAGHANLGSGFWRTEEGRMQLSIYRANVVANYLIGLNIPADRITIRGYGATRMIADHTNPATQWRNMRAEITILDN